MQKGKGKRGKARNEHGKASTNEHGKVQSWGKAVENKAAPPRPKTKKERKENARSFKRMQRNAQAYLNRTKSSDHKTREIKPGPSSNGPAPVRTFFNPWASPPRHEQQTPAQLGHTSDVMRSQLNDTDTYATATKGKPRKTETYNDAFPALGSSPKNPPDRVENPPNRVDEQTKMYSSPNIWEPVYEQ